MTPMSTEADPRPEHPPLPSLARRASIMRPEDIPKNYPLTPGRYSAVAEIACAIAESAQSEGGKVFLLYLTGTKGEEFKAYFSRKRAIEFSGIIARIIADLLPEVPDSAGDDLAERQPLSD